MTRADAVALVAAQRPPGALTIACNGMIARELYAHADSPTHFYLIGAMGLAASVGLGLALVQPQRPVIVFDGDGNLLMNMGALASVAASGAANFFHVVFDNAAHGSTGNQRTVSDRVPLERVAHAAGYRRAERVAGRDELDAALVAFFAGDCPAMLLVEVEKGNQPGIGRIEIAPQQLTERFRGGLLEK